MSSCSPASTSAVHSHTLPIMFESPKALGENASTAQVPVVGLLGKAPWNTFACGTPPGSSSSPHGNVVADPARAAYSHSASVGSRFPAQAAKAAASFALTCTTGWSPPAVLCGPCGVRQVAWGTCRHQGAAATPRVSGKSSGSRPAKTNDQPIRSASVT